MAVRHSPVFLLLLAFFAIVLGASVSAACYTNASAAPVTCSGGTIEQDEWDGACRTISCINTTSGLMLLACDKPDGAAKTFFELYKVAEVGPKQLEVCVGDACLHSYGLSGFARSANYPICPGGGSNDAGAGTGNGIGDGTNHTGNDTSNDTSNDTGNSTGNSTGGDGASMSVDVLVAPFYPQDASYVLICNATGFAPAGFDWYFGDETQLLNVTNDNVFHTFLAPGNYTVTCVAHTDGLTYSDDLGVVIAPTGPPVEPPVNDTNETVANETCSGSVVDMPIACTGGPLSNVVIEGDCLHAECNTPLASLHVQACDKPDTGEKTHFEMYRTEASGSDPLELCIGGTCLRNNDGLGFASSSAFPVCYEPAPICGDGIVNGNEECDTTAPAGFECYADCTLGEDEPRVDLSVAPFYLQNVSYVFVCEPYDFTPTSFDWIFGDGQQQLNVSNGDVFHVFEAAGDYTVACTAHADGLTLSDEMNVSVGLVVPPPPANETCFSSVSEMPIACTGGTLQSTVEGDCVHAECTASLDSLQIMACDKPDDGEKTHFEMYRQEASGSDPVEICIGGTCLRNDDHVGFVRSGGFPLCTGGAAD